MPKAKVRDGVFQRKDRSGWFVSYIDASGARKKEKVEAHTRTQALTTLSAIKVREERNRVLGVKVASEISTAELLDRYSRYQKSRLRPTSFERLIGILPTLNRHFPERAKAITRTTVQDFISSRAQAVAPGTIEKEVTVLKHALRLAVEWELLPNNVARDAKLPRISEGRTRYLTPLELKATLDAASDRMKPPIALAAFTGMRRGELLTLQWQDVDLHNRRLYLRETKNGSLRVLPLNEVAAQVLSDLTRGAADERVFNDVNPHRLTVYIRRLFAKLDISNASFHSLRHTAASWLVMGGVDLYAVGRILGHKTPRMTQRYAHLSPEYLSGAVGKLDGVFGGLISNKRPN